MQSSMTIGQLLGPAISGMLIAVIAFVGDGANDGTRHDALAASDGDPVGGVALGERAGRAT